MSEINRERLIEHFFQLIKIDSESRNEKQIAETLAEQLGAMGLAVHKLPVPHQVSNGFNVYARLEGSLDGSIVLSSHMDTVTPGIGIEPVIEDGIIRSKGDTILGGDDKSGIAAIMELSAVFSLTDWRTKPLNLPLRFMKKVVCLVLSTLTCHTSRRTKRLFLIQVGQSALSSTQHQANKR